MKGGKEHRVVRSNSQDLRYFPWTEHAAKCGHELLDLDDEAGQISTKKSINDKCTSYHLHDIMHSVAIQAVDDISSSIADVSRSTFLSRRSLCWCNSSAIDQFMSTNPSSLNKLSDHEILREVRVDQKAKRHDKTTQGIVMFGTLKRKQIAIKFTPMVTEISSIIDSTTIASSVLKIPDDAHIEACACALLNTLTFRGVSPFFVRTYMYVPCLMNLVDETEPHIVASATTTPARQRNATSLLRKRPQPRPPGVLELTRLSNVLRATELELRGVETNLWHMGLKDMLKDKILRLRGKERDTRLTLLNRIVVASNKISEIESASPKGSSIIVASRSAEEEETRGSRKEALRRDIIASHIVMESMPKFSNSHLLGVKCMVQQRLSGTMTNLFNTFIKKPIPHDAKIRMMHSLMCQQFLAISALQAELGMIHHDAHFENWGHVNVDTNSFLLFEDTSSQSSCFSVGAGAGAVVCADAGADDSGADTVADTDVDADTDEDTDVDAGPDDSGAETVADTNAAQYRIPTFGVILKLFDFGRCSFAVRSRRIMSEYAAHREIRAPGFISNFQIDVLRIVYEWFMISPGVIDLLHKGSPHSPHKQAIQTLQHVMRNWTCERSADPVCVSARDKLAQAGISLDGNVWFDFIMSDSVRSGVVSNKYLDVTWILKRTQHGGLGFLEPFEEPYQQEEEGTRERASGTGASTRVSPRLKEKDRIASYSVLYRRDKGQSEISSFAIMK